MKRKDLEGTLIDVEHVARLAQLALTEEEKKKMGQEMAAFLAFARTLDEVKMPEEGAASSKTGPKAQREDTVTPSLGREQLLANAPQVKEGQVFVPGAQGGPSDIQ